MEKIVVSRPGIQIVSIIGRQGVGKTHVGKYLAATTGARHIEASSVVKEVCGDLPRERMPATNRRTASEPTWLGDAIYNRIDGYTFSKTIPKTIIISGIREVEVHQTLAEKYKLRLFIIALSAPAEIRFERLKNLGKCENLDQFIRHEFNEIGIGLDKVLESAHAKYSTVANDPNDVVATIKGLLENREVI